MREIKFRVWYEEGGYIMLTWEQLKSEADFSWFIDEELAFMQYTGLKDKHGVEIYEGDIVILCWSDEVGESHWGKVIIKNPFEYTPEEARYFIYSDEIEVIGNIYQNKDLLEVK